MKVYISVELYNGIITDVNGFRTSEKQDEHEEKWRKEFEGDSDFELLLYQLTI